MSERRFVLALDQGTTSSRAIVFDRRGTIRGVGQREFRQLLPRPGWVEHDADEIWSSQAAVVGEALAGARVGPDDIAAVGITNQRETTVMWDRATGRPLHHALVWQDRRTAPLCRRLRQEGHEDEVRRRTGLVLDPYFSASKIAWLLDTVDGARERAEAGELAFGTVDSWLLWRLTGGVVHATDATNASRTLLWNLREGDWDDDMLRLFDVPRSLLPDVVDSSGVIAEITAVPELAGIPVAGVLGDQQAALAGQVCFEPGLAKNTYGTGCFLLLHTGDEARVSEHRLLTTVAWRAAGRTTYAFEGSVFIGGAVVQWLRDGLGLIERSEDVEALAREATDNGGVYFVPAFVGLGAPHWDPYARGALLGLTRGTSRAHVARAAVEAIAFQVADLLEAMEAEAGTAVVELRVDGGAAVNDLLLQFQADISRRPVVRPTVVETTALGAAYAAGLATDVWSGLDDIRENWQVDRRFEPAMAETEAARLRERWGEAVRRASRWEPE